MSCIVNLSMIGKGREPQDDHHPRLPGGHSLSLVMMMIMRALTYSLLLLSSSSKVVCVSFLKRLTMVINFFESLMCKVRGDRSLIKSTERLYEEIF